MSSICPTAQRREKRTRNAFDQLRNSVQRLQGDPTSFFSRLPRDITDLIFEESINQYDGVCECCGRWKPVTTTIHHYSGNFHPPIWYHRFQKIVCERCECILDRATKDVNIRDLDRTVDRFLGPDNTWAKESVIKTLNYIRKAANRRKKRKNENPRARVHDRTMLDLFN